MSRTSNIRNAEDADGPGLDDATLVRQQRGGSGNGASRVRGGTVRQIALVVGIARLLGAQTRGQPRCFPVSGLGDGDGGGDGGGHDDSSGPRVTPERVGMTQRRGGLAVVAGRKKKIKRR